MQAEAMSSRDSQWLLLLHELVQSGQTVELGEISKVENIYIAFGYITCGQR